MTATCSAPNTPAPASPGVAGRVAVVGYGLIGGSLAQAVDAAGPVARVRVWDPEAAARQLAAGQLGAAAVASSLQAAVGDADLVVLAVPAAAFAAVVRAVIDSAPATAVLSDVASVKGAIVEIVRNLPPAQRRRFVPAHPIAGSHHSGAGHAHPDLFLGRQVILTPMKDTGIQHMDRVRRFWLGLGSHVTVMSPEAHDEVFSAVSHLPHLIAFAYLGALAGSSLADDYAALAGSGFRDFTRIAGANPALWADICVSNRQALLRDLESFRRELALLCSALATGDRVAMAERFATARALRLAHERHALAQAPSDLR